jgi:hypothetical protein
MGGPIIELLCGGAPTDVNAQRLTREGLLENMLAEIAGKK